MSSPDMLRGLATSTHIFALALEHARRLHLESVFIYLGVGNTLGGCTVHWYSFTPVLVTRSGATSRIGIYLPRRWQHARGLRLLFICPVLVTRSGAASYAVNLNNLQHYQLRLLRQLRFDIFQLDAKDFTPC
jgi:hypothetical protein